VELLALRDVDFAYARTPLFTGLNLALEAGKVIGIVGPNGAGKTTLLNLLTGLVKPKRGEISFLGEDLGNMRGDIAYLPQEISIPDNYRLDSLASLLHVLNHNFDTRRFFREVEELGLARRTKFSELSSGLKGQVLLAAALARGGKMIVLDEPFAFFDPIARRTQTKKILCRKIDLQATVLISSHVVEELDHICDEILVINRGRILFHEDVDMLKFSHAFIQTESSAISGIDPRDIIFRDTRNQVGIHLIANSHKYENSGFDLLPASLKEIVLGYLEHMPLANDETLL
jgi:ABC-2 type transport system ATP-binding protein